MSPILRVGFEPWRPLFVAALPELEAELLAELGPVRAHSLRLNLEEHDQHPQLAASITTGDPNHAGTERIVRAWLDPVVQQVPNMALTVDITHGPRLRVVDAREATP